MNNIITKHLLAFASFNNLQEKKFQVTLTKDPKFGNYTTNFCFLYAKSMQLSMLELGQKIIDFLMHNYADFYEKIEFVNPGYINFYLKQKVNTAILNQILEQKELFPIIAKNNQKISIEFVSANPTGKLHLAHAYAAIFGNSLVDIARKVGYEVEKEFYINDAGNQIDKLAVSVLIRYLNLFGRNFELFEDAYHGLEIIDCAQALKQKFNDQFAHTLFDEQGILDPNANEIIKNFAKDYMLDMITKDLSNIGVYFDRWTSEKNLYDYHDVQNVLEALKKSGATYEQDNALWLKTSQYGDDKDRVLVKNNGLLTYLVPDIALHVNKFKRNYDHYFNIWGMDHHGYIPRLKIALQILGYDPKKLDIICIQVMKLVKNGEEFKLSKRAGTSLTLQELVEAIGQDELKWICTSYQTSSHKIIDVDKIKSHDKSNSLFYVEYACARIHGILNKNQDELIQANVFDQINDQKTIDLINELSLYEQTLKNVVIFKETHLLNTYLYKLATKFHDFYTEVNITNLQNKILKNQLLNVIKAVLIVLENGLNLLGIKAYEKM